MDRKLTESEFRELYSEQRVSIYEIASLFGTSRTTLNRLRCQWGIPKRPPSVSWVGKRNGRLVIVSELPWSGERKAQCVCQCDCGRQHTVARGNFLSTESCGCVGRWGEQGKLSQDVVGRLYTEELRTDKEIAEHLGVKKSTVNQARAKWGVETILPIEREARKNEKPRLTREALRKVYIEEHGTLDTIAEFFGVGSSTVGRKLEEWGFPKLDRFEPWTGKRHGRLVILEETRGYSDTPIKCLCQCDCGRQTLINRGAFLVARGCGCLAKLPPGEAARRAVLCTYQYSAEVRGLLFEISDVEALSLFTLDCWYCGAPPSRTRKLPTGSFTYNGIDRLENALGYTRENVVPCCWNCNNAKGAMTLENFLSHVGRIRQRDPEPPLQSFDPRLQPLLCRYRRQAWKRGLVWSLAEGEAKALFSSPCVYCNTPAGNALYGVPYNGIDRVDSALGYMSGNVVSACWDCNRMKFRRSPQDFFSWAETLKKRYPALTGSHI